MNDPKDKMIGSLEREVHRLRRYLERIRDWHQRSKDHDSSWVKLLVDDALSGKSV
jgi:hypothetical protein